MRQHKALIVSILILATSSLRPRTAARVGDQASGLQDVANITVDGGPAGALKELQSGVLSKTAVPVRWPLSIPYSDDKKAPLYAIAAANHDGYEVELAWDPRCSGQNVCHYGSIRGSSKAIAENEGQRQSVTLHHGIRGYFIDSTCGAHCDDAAIGWAEGNFHYSISMKAGDEPTLTRMANSAIDSSQQHRP